MKSNTRQAKDLVEVLDRMGNLTGDALETHLEADYLLLDALVLLRQSDLVTAYMEAKRIHRFDY